MMIVVVGCGGSEDAAPSTPAAPAAPTAPAPPAPPVELTPIRLQNCVGVLSVAVAPLVIGGALGFLEEEGISEILVNNTGAGSTATCVQLTAQGEADVTSPIPEGLLNALAQGIEPGITCASNSIRRSIAAIAVDPDGPFGDYASLAGQKIGVHDLSSGFIPIFEQALIENGVDPATVEYQNTGFGAQAANALFTGEVAASAYWDFEMGAWSALGFPPKLLPLPDAVSELFSSCLAFNNDLIASRPDLVAGYARAVAKSIVFAEENPEAAVQLFWEFAPENKPTGMTDEEALERDVSIMQARLANHSRVDGDPDPRWGAWTPQQWRTYVEFLGLDESLNVESLYTLQFVDQINDFDEQAVRMMARSFTVGS